MTTFVATIKSDGKPMDPSIELMSLEIRKELDRIPEATLVVLDGDPAAREFKLSNGAFFAPGRLITIMLRYEGKPDAQVFSGLVVRHAVEVGEGGTELRLELKDAALALTRRRRSRVLFDARDSDLYRKLASRARLAVGTIDATSAVHPQIVQYNATDWDFLLSRADVNGQVVLVDDGELSVRSMSADAPARVRLEWGLDEIHELELELDGGGQYAAVTGTAWDPAQHETLEVEAAQLTATAGDTNAAALARKLGAPEYALVLPAAATRDELQPWASGRLARSRLSLLRGRLVIAGRADLKPFDRVELGGVGKRFDGKLLVSGVVHKLDHDGWSTELQIGLSPEWFARTPDLADVPAGGLLPPAMTLQIGTVDGVEADPRGEFRVRVKLPGLAAPDHDKPPDPAAAENVVWARMAMPDAGKARGFNFWPEHDDEVVVGFLAGDPRQAVVLGALYSSHAPPPADLPDRDHDVRAIVSKAGSKVTFDDKKKSVTIVTPKGNTVVVDDDADAITLRDSRGSTVTLDASGVALKSAGDLTLEASGKVVIKGSTVDIQ